MFSLSPFLGSHGVIVRKEEYSEVQVPADDYVDIVTTHITDPSLFCCQLVAKADDIDSMMAALDEKYKQTKAEPTFEWKNGMPIVALFSGIHDLYL